MGTFQNTFSAGLGSQGSLLNSYVLDLYTGSLLAISFRKVRKLYTGNCIRVRRSSDDTEQDIGFANNKLDEVALLAFCGSGSGFVRTFYDQSIIGNNAYQDSAAYQPQIVLNGKVLKNEGLPSLYFFNIAYLKVTSTIIGTSVTSVLGVVNTISDTNNSGLVGQYALVVADLQATATDLAWRATTATPFTFASNINLKLASAWYVSGAVHGFYNGVEGSNSPLTKTQLANITGIGVNRTAVGLNGYISELIINGTDNYVNRAKIEAEILKYYTLPVAHNPKYYQIEGDSIALRLFASGVVNLRRYSGHLHIGNSAVSGSNLAYQNGSEGTIWNKYSFIGKSIVGATYMIDLTDIDTLVVWAGFNDVYDNVPLGAIDSNDIYTIAGAIRVGVANYRSRKPSLKIIFVNPNANPYQGNNALGLAIADYAAHILAVCASINVPCYDMYTNCGITDANKATTIEADHIHPAAAYLASTLSVLIGNYISVND